MSAHATTLDAPVDGRVDYAAIGGSPIPQVNLLPPEIRSRRNLGRVKTRLGIALIFVVLLSALAFAWGVMAESQAADELAAKQDEVARLTAEQQQYAEVPRIKSSVATAEEARAFGMSTEIMWNDYLLRIVTAAPEGVRFETLTTTLPSPMQEPVPASNPLAAASVGSISFTTRSATLPDIAAWITALEAVPGFSDAAFSSAEISDDEGVVYYETASSVQVDQSVYALRFAPEEGE